MYSLRPVVVDLTEADFSIYHHVEIVTFFTLKGDYGILIVVKKFVIEMLV